MSIMTEGQAPPDWCELRRFAILTLGAGEEADLPPGAPRLRVLATDGTVQIKADGRSWVLKPAQFLDLPSDAKASVHGIADGCRLVALSGRWGNDVASCGIFGVENRPDARDGGDPVSYPKTTAIDAHYHDCDEYWIILVGSGTVVVGGRHHAVKAGDCVAIGMGHHHDFPQVVDPVRAVFFETTLEGQKRVGHLWEHTHGPAHPQPDRV